jgi:molecular chaperone GrpE
LRITHLGVFVQALIKSYRQELFLESRKEKLLAQFAAFLEQGTQGAGPEEDGSPDPERQEPDLYTLFVEMAALKAEVKKDARQHKESVGYFHSLLETLQANNQQLTQELAHHQKSRQEAVLQAQQDLLEEMIDLQDRLQATMDNIHAFKPPFWERRASRVFRSGLAEGLEITMRRMEQMLGSHGVTPLQAVGRPFDPHTMRVVEVRKEEGQADGIVLEEIRRGYLRQGKLFRLAEVVANRHGGEGVGLQAE